MAGTRTEEMLTGLKEVIDGSAEKDDQIASQGELLESKDTEIAELKRRLKELSAFEPIVEETKDKKQWLISGTDMTLYKQLLARSTQLYHNTEHRFLKRIVEECVRTGLFQMWGTISKKLKVEEDGS